MPPLPADSIHARACKLKCEKILTRPNGLDFIMVQKGVNAYINIKCHFFNDICKKAPPPLVKRWRSL